VGEVPHPPLHTTYHHEESCGVRTRGEGIYTPLFLLYPYVAESMPSY